MSSLNFGYFAGGVAQGAARGLDMYAQYSALKGQQDATSKIKDLPQPGALEDVPGAVPPPADDVAPQALQPNDSTNTSAPGFQAAIPGVASYMAPGAAAAPQADYSAPSGIALPQGSAGWTPPPAAAPDPRRQQWAAASRLAQSTAIPATPGVAIPPNNQEAITPSTPPVAAAIPTPGATPPTPQTTILPPDQESAYRQWMDKIGMTKDKGMNVDSNYTGNDYDMRGYYQKYGGTDHADGQHFTDEFKLPNHPTFSDQSRYATGDAAPWAGKWNGDKYVPSAIRSAADANKPAEGPSANYLSNLNQRESGGNATATNPASSATGQGQFINSTWMSIFPKLHPELTQGKTQEQILAYRNDPKYSDEASTQLATENMPMLKAAGVPINDTTLGTAHTFGASGASAMYNAPPTAKMEDVVGAQSAQANNVTGKTVGEVKAGIAGQFGAKPDATAQNVPQGPPQPPPVPPIVAPQTTAGMGKMTWGPSIDSQGNLGPRGQPDYPAPPPGKRYVTQDDYSQRVEQVYRSSGRPEMIAVADRMQANRLAAAESRQLLERGDMQALADRGMKQIGEVRSLYASGNVEAAGDLLQSYYNHGVPNGARMRIIPANGPNSEGQVVVAHYINDQLVGQDKPQSFDKLLANAESMTNPSAYKEFTKASDEHARSQAEMNKWSTDAALTNEKIRLGSTAAEIRASDAKADTERETAKWTGAAKASLIETQQRDRADALEVARLRGVAADQNASEVDRAGATRALLLRQGKEWDPHYETVNLNGDRVKHDPLAPTPDVMYSTEMGDNVPLGTKAKEIAADPDYIANNVRHVWSKGQFGFIVKGHETDEQGRPQWFKDFQDAKDTFHGKTPAALPSTRGAPTVGRAGAPAFASPPAAIPSAASAARTRFMSLPKPAVTQTPAAPSRYALPGGPEGVTDDQWNRRGIQQWLDSQGNH